MSIIWPRRAIAAAMCTWMWMPGAVLCQPAIATDVAAKTGIAPRTFMTPQEAATALVSLSRQMDVAGLAQLFGAAGNAIVSTGEAAQDRQHVMEFAAAAAEGYVVSMDPKNRGRAFVLIGNQSWPFPVPIVKRNGRWSFDAAAGRQELLQRRIGSNELDAIKICRGYVEAQREYALKKREGYDVHQYAQRIVSTPGKQDGLAWKKPDGEWDGPVGEAIARAIEQGYSSGAQPYHGYFFKILKAQGPAAPLGEMNFVIEGAMIGGFALAASPAQYGATGVKTFMVSHTGVVYERDLGPNTLEEFTKMERFNPDRFWSPVAAQDD